MPFPLLPQDGNTPLIFAARSLSYVDLFLQDGKTARDYAVEKGYEAIVELLDARVKVPPPLAVN